MFYEYFFPLYACLFICFVLFNEGYFIRLLFCGYCLPHSVLFTYIPFLSLGCEFLEEKKCEHFLFCAPSLQHRSWPMSISGSREEEIYIPFSVFYHFGESTSTLIIQFFWFRWRLPLSNPSLGMDTWPKLGQLKLCPAVLQEIGAWRDTHPPPIRIHKDT